MSPGPGPTGAPELVLASANRGKLAEVRALLAPRGLRVVSPPEAPAIDWPEEGDDYAANALAKAGAVVRQLGRAALADDSGLEVRGLRGGPGPFSARYGGPGLDDAGRVAQLLAALAGQTGSDREARFVCAAAFAAPDGRAVSARGECAGLILPAPRGSGGFGYDPVFLVAGGDHSMAQLTAEEKNRLSHRARAFAALCDAAGLGHAPEP